MPAGLALLTLPGRSFRPQRVEAFAASQSFASIDHDGTRITKNQHPKTLVFVSPGNAYKMPLRGPGFRAALP